MLTSYTPNSDLRRNPYAAVSHAPAILAVSCKQTKGMGLCLFVSSFRHVREWFGHRRLAKISKHGESRCANLNGNLYGVDSFIIFFVGKMATQVLADSLKSVFKHTDFKSKLQREAIECLHEGKLKLKNLKSFS